MAYPRGVHVGDAIFGVALCRAVIISRDWPLVLVACGSALAEHCEAGSVHDPVPLFCYAALRYPFRISGFLRPRDLPDLLVFVRSLRIYGARGSAVCSCFDVDLRHSGVSDSRRDLSHAAALSGEKVYTQQSSTSVQSPPGESA
jgi:hypothetical protein